MINLSHFVLDLETMGKGPLAAIVAIGCVLVDNGKIAAEFYERVDLESSIAAGGVVDGSTVQWWLQQAAEARSEVDGRLPSIPLEIALRMLADFMHTAPRRNSRLWGNGSSFDNVIVGTAFDRLGIPRPWDFWSDRDLRTLVEICPAAKRSIQFEGTKHHALADANYEAQVLCAALQLMATATDEEETRA